MFCASLFAYGAVQLPRQDLSPFSISTASSNSTRAFTLAEKRAGWEYGPSIAGDTAWYPVGSIGVLATKAAYDRFSGFQDGINAKVIANSKIAEASIAAVRT